MHSARTVQNFNVCVFMGTVPPPPPPLPSNCENPLGSNKNTPPRQKETPGIIQRPLATIHNLSPQAAPLMVNIW